MNYFTKLTLLIFFTSITTFASEYVVIANKNLNTTLSKEQIKAIFLKKIILVNDIELVPLNLKVDAKLRKEFQKEILNMSFTRLQNYWIKEHYLGVRPPLNLHSQQSIKLFVQKVDGAIGYIESRYLDDNLLELYRWSNSVQ